jgi:hypothetical protein
MPGVIVANVEQQDWFADVATDVLLPRFKPRRTNPSLMVFWSRDPDGTQHYQGDSLNSLTPGINGPTAMKSASATPPTMLAASCATALKTLGLDADHRRRGHRRPRLRHPLASDEPHQRLGQADVYRDTKPGFLPHRLPGRRPRRWP